MRISKWVDMGQEVEIDIGMDEIRSAMAESFTAVTMDRLGEPGPSTYDVTRALNSIAAFLNAMTDEHIALLNPAQRKIAAEFFERASARFSVADSDLQLTASGSGTPVNTESR